MAYPQPYTTTSPIVASYNYTDLSDGTGYRTFYALVSETSSGNEYFLSQSSDYGEDDVDTTTEQDYDLTPFNMPQTIKGTATINFYGRMSGGGDTSWGAKLSHYDGTTETAISSTITSKTYAGDLQVILKIPLTETLFAEGDILRLTLTHTGTDASAFYVSASQPIKLNIPFKIDN